MFEPQTLIILFLVVGAWLAQAWLTNRQTQRFHRRSQELRRTGAHLAVGLAGSMFKGKVFATLVVDESGVVTAAERLSGVTVFARAEPVPQVVGLHLEEIGAGDPPPGLSAKTWAAFAHAAGFLHRKVNTGRGEEPR